MGIRCHFHLGNASTDMKQYLSRAIPKGNMQIVRTPYNGTERSFTLAMTTIMIEITVDRLIQIFLNREGHTVEITVDRPIQIFFNGEGQVVSTVTV